MSGSEEEEWVEVLSRGELEQMQQSPPAAGVDVNAAAAAAAAQAVSKFCLF